MVYERTVVGTLSRTPYWKRGSEHWYPLALGRGQLMVGDLFLPLSKQLEKLRMDSSDAWTEIGFSRRGYAA